MAEALVNVLLERLGAIAIDKVGEEFKLVIGVEKEVENLIGKLNAIKDVLKDAEQRQVTEARVRRWLSKLTEVSFEMDDVLDEWITDVLKRQTEKQEQLIVATKKVCCPCHSSCCCFGQVNHLRRDIALRIQELNERIASIDNGKQNFSFQNTISVPEQPQPQQQKSTSLPNVKTGLSFKSEPSTASTSLTSGRSSLEFLNDKNKQGGSFDAVSSTLFSGTFATTASASSNSFGFSSVASTPTVTSQAPGSAHFSGGSGTGSGTHVSPAGTGVVPSTQCAHVQLGSSSSSSVFSGSSAVGSSTPSSGVNPSSSSTAPSTAFGSGWLPATSSKFSSTVISTSFAPAFRFDASSASAATNTSSIYSFGASSSFAATSNSAAMVFGMSHASAPAPAPASNSLPTLLGASTVSAPTTNSASGFGMSNGASSTGVLSFASTAASQPAFDNSNPMGFSTASSGNNDQMSMEDSMAEDTVHASQPTVAAFGQQSVSAPQSTPAFQFSQQPVSTPQTPSVFGGSTNGFPFQSQPNQSNSHNPSPFQPVNGLANSQSPSTFQGSNSLRLTTNSFSLGAADKSNRKFVKVNRSKNRKK